MNTNFLHVHSTFSIGDSAQSPDDIVRRIKELGGRNVTLTDHRTLLGVDPFMDAGKKYGINTIPGVENEVSLPKDYAVRLSNGDPERAEALQSARNHLLLVPFDYEGFQSISYATRDANTNLHHVNKTAYPCMTDTMLEKHFKGNPHVFATSACIQGPIGYLLLINFRIKEQMRRYIENENSCKEDYQRYLAAEKEEAELKEKIKELSKTITAESKPLKKPHQNKIKNLKTKLTSLEPDSTQYQKTAMQLEVAQNMSEVAKSRVDELNTQLDGLKRDKEMQTKLKAEAKKGYNKYAKALTKLDTLKSCLVEEGLLYAAAKSRLLYLKSIFPHFYMEMQNHGLEAERYVMPILLRLADETNTPIIAANDAHITENSEACIEARRVIRFNFFNKAEEVTPADREMYIKTDEELVQALSQVIPKDRAVEAVKNLSVLEKCHVQFPNDPHYPKVRGADFDGALAKARDKRIKAGTWNEEYQKRLEHEVQVIKSMGYVDYHMVVEQFCRIGRLMGRVPENRRPEIYDHFPDLAEWVEKEGFDIGIGIGPGRGSAAGSLVCYLLGITNIDPIRYNLLFERFLNPERVSMPDIDTDIATSIRPILIAYLRWYYGENAVCSIATVNKYEAKAAIQLAGRDRASQLYGLDKEKKSQYLHKISYAVSDLVPATPGIKMADCEKDIMARISNHSEMKLVWERAKLIEGCVSTTGVHAGGVIISDNSNVNEYVPLAWNEEKNVWVAQCDMIKAEEKGMLKMDVLGLNTLDIENVCVQLIKQHHGVSVDLNAIPFEPEVFEKIYASGNTNGVFQVESDGMKQMLRDFKPTCFEDIILLVAAYRPGPMQYLPDVIAVKNGKKKVSYKHPMLESILSTTYGATIYQEQVMQIFQKLAGYSLGGADLVRRAMSKKKMEKLAHERVAFIYGDAERGIDGCIKRGVSEETANVIFDEMMEFAKYAFNKSHAAAYAYVSYQTAWLKYHYPTEFLCALFTCKGQDKYAPVIADCGLYGVELLQPDINFSYYKFVIEGKNIRYGISGIKGVGEAYKDVITVLCEERKKGYYTSFQDFILRMFPYDETGKSSIPGKLIQTLINVGAFDALGYNREALIDALGDMQNAKVQNAEEYTKAVSQTTIKTLEPDSSYNYEKESELLGTICSVRPLEKYGSDQSYGCTPVSELSDGNVSVFGFVVDTQILKTKKGADLMLMKLQGKTGECTLLFMGNAFTRYANERDQYCNKVVKATGKANTDTVFCNRIALLNASMDHFYLNVLQFEDQQYLESLNELHKEKSGEDVLLYMQVHYYKSGRKIEPPVVMKRYCSMQVINDLKRKGIRVVKN